VNYRQAVVRSVRFAYCQSHLFGGYVLVVVVLRLFENVFTSTLGLVALAVVAIRIPLETVVLALFYREFVWREREAAARPTESA
jgi:branched-subunit amino acid ABC-type transport system permease component